MTINNTVQASPGLNVNTPGQPVTNNIALPQQFGMFPPNSNNQGGGSVAAALAGSGSANGQPQLAPNMYITNEGVGNSITIVSALGTGSDGGNQASAANGIPTGSAIGGGSPGGQGGANANSDIGKVGDVQLGAQAPAINITFQGSAANPQYAG
jgi:hypothetical protein